jgi:hypothetical protein
MAQLPTTTATPALKGVRLFETNDSWSSYKLTRQVRTSRAARAAGAPKSYTEEVATMNIPKGSPMPSQEAINTIRMKIIAANITPKNLSDVENDAQELLNRTRAGRSLTGDTETVERTRASLARVRTLKKTLREVQSAFDVAGFSPVVRDVSGQRHNTEVIWVRGASKEWGNTGEVISLKPFEPFDYAIHDQLKSVSRSNPHDVVVEGCCGGRRYEKLDWSSYPSPHSMDFR